MSSPGSRRLFHLQLKTCPLKYAIGERVINVPVQSENVQHVKEFLAYSSFNTLLVSRT